MKISNLIMDLDVLKKKLGVEPYKLRYDLRKLKDVMEKEAQPNLLLSDLKEVIDDLITGLDEELHYFDMDVIDKSNAWIKKVDEEKNGLAGGVSKYVEYVPLYKEMCKAEWEYFDFYRNNVPKLRPSYVSEKGKNQWVRSMAYLPSYILDQLESEYRLRSENLCSTYIKFDNTLKEMRISGYFSGNKHWSEYDMDLFEHVMDYYNIYVVDILNSLKLEAIRNEIALRNAMVDESVYDCMLDD
jgi:hypothetical protein